MTLGQLHRVAPGRPGQALDKGADRHRGAPKETLGIAAVQPVKFLDLSLAFHAFGDHGEAQRVRQVEDGLDDHRVIGVYA